ncbi:MAG TPA: hypothetical protein VMM77_10460 [Gemmatimonadaceae bacterium]|nr:hypothetical protein [Gemmatimonadaceae bacterium]
MKISSAVFRAALLGMVFTAACNGPEGTARDTADTAAPGGDTTQASASCLPIVPSVRGSLVGQRDSAQREARRVRVSGEGVAHRDSAGGTVTITPTCGSHTFREGDLARGQFVARLAINGNAPRFSRFPNDTVYWWVYLDLTSGQPVFRSEFLSTAVVSDTGRAYLRRGDFVIRCKAAGNRPKAEVAGWEPAHGPEPCPASDARMQLMSFQAAGDSGTQGGGGNSPWFGCTLGCCQSNTLVLDEQ